MKLWRLLAVLLLIGGVSILSGCGDSNFDSHPGGGVAFTPTPAPTPQPKLCGNGELDPGEQCDAPMVDACTGDQECVCCICLSPGEELGTRTFTVARPPSGLYSSGLGGTDVAVGLETLPGPLVMHAGRPDPTLEGEEACSAPLTMEQDVIVGFRNPIGFACTKIFAEGSSGTIDCDGGTAHNIEYVIDSNGSEMEFPPVISTGLGKCCTSEDGVACAADPAELCDPAADPSECSGEFPVCSTVGAGPGAATLQSPLTLTVLLSVDSTLDDCNCLANATTPEEAVADCPPFAVAQGPDEVVVSPVALTTKIGQGMVLNPAQGGTPPEIEQIGQNFVCANWRETDSEGILVMPLSGLDQPVVSDTINAYVLGDQAPESP